MTAYTRAELQAIYQQIDANEPGHSKLRGMIELCLLDNIFSVERVTNDPLFRSFEQIYGREIAFALREHHYDQEHKREEITLHNDGRLDDTFDLLTQKYVSTQKRALVPIKLAAASGMTEYPHKLSLGAIQSFLENALRETDVDLEDVMGTVIEKLTMRNQYDRNPSYRLRIMLGVDEIDNWIFLHISHDTRAYKKSKGFYVPITRKKDNMHHILHNTAYTIDNRFDEIIHTLRDEEDEHPNDSGYDFA